MRQLVNLIPLPEAISELSTNWAIFESKLSFFLSVQFFLKSCFCNPYFETLQEQLTFLTVLKLWKNLPRAFEARLSATAIVTIPLKIWLLYSRSILTTFSNILLETIVPNLVPQTLPSLQIMGKTQTEVFPNSRFLINPL